MAAQIFLIFDVSELDGADNVIFRDFLRARLHHDDAIGSADDHDVELAGGALGVGGIDDEVALDEADADGADGAMEGDVRERERAAGGVDADHVRIVFLISGVDERDDLGLVAESFGEERTDGTIDLAAGEHFFLTGATFALDEAAGNASAGVGELAVFDREGKEVDTFLGVWRGGGGGQDGIIAASGEGGAGRLLGHAAGLELDVLAAGKLYGDFMFHAVPLLFSADSLLAGLRDTEEVRARRSRPQQKAQLRARVGCED